MKARVAASAVLVSVGLTSAAWPQMIGWDFGEAEGRASPSADTAPFVSGGSVTNGNTSLGGIGTSSSSYGYAGASGGYSAYLTARPVDFSTGPEGASFFELAVWPSIGYGLSATNLAFGTRSTSTGPQAFCVRSSLDGYATDLASGAILPDGVWYWKSVPLALTSTVAGAAVVLRIYGCRGSGSGTGNWRVDDVALDVRAHAVWDATPPDLAQVPPQRVRVGGAPLSFALAITPSEGDPVFYTNVVASSGVSGAWSLSAGLFTYAPSDTDCGARAFTFSVADKDGTNAMTVAVSVLRRATDAVRLADPSGAYVQNFDAMAGSGAANEWDNAAYPFAGWYAFSDASSVTAYRAGTGAETSGGLYSFGASSTNADRSLGSLASGERDYRYGVAFTNETGLALTNVAVSFCVEQWRVGASASTNALVFEYCVTNRALPLTQGAWRRVRACGFSTPAVTNSGQAAGAGYWAAPAAAVLGQPVAEGAVLLLRWTDVDDPGNDHAFGIDDLTVAWAAGPFPQATPVGRGGAAQTFDEMNTNAVADLPYPWRIGLGGAMRTSGAYDDALVHSACANTSTNVCSAGAYNFASRAFGDQAVGGLSSGASVKSVTLYGKFVNASGAPAARWSVVYGVEKYRNGTVGTAVQLLASTDGRTWQACGAPTAFAADGNTNGCAVESCPAATVAVGREVVFAPPVANGGVFHLAWQISAASGEQSEGTQALGVDDVQIAPVHAVSGAWVLVR